MTDPYLHYQGGPPPRREFAVDVGTSATIRGIEIPSGANPPVQQQEKVCVKTLEEKELWQPVP